MRSPRITQFPACRPRGARRRKLTGSLEDFLIALLQLPRLDGTYTGIAIQNNSKGNTLAPGGGTGTVKCQNYDEPPKLTVTNGFAQFDALGVRFAGYVTPQGHLKMHTDYGATVVGQINSVPIDEDSTGISLPRPIYCTVRYSGSAPIM